MARTRGELEVIRIKNRQKLGLAEYAEAPASDVGEVFDPANQGDPEVLTLKNPRPLGVAGLAGSVPGLGFDFSRAIPSIRLTTAFPPVDVTFEPGQDKAPPSEGPGWADWATRHVVRPVVEVGGVRVAPYERDADFSGVAKLAAIGVLAVLSLAGAWTIARAAYPTRRGIA